MRWLLRATGMLAVAAVLTACGTSGQVSANGSWSSSPSASVPSSTGAAATQPASPTETATEQDPPQDAPSGDSLPAPGSVGSRAGLTIQVTGSCHDFRGFRLKSTGFTVDRQYRTIAWYPDGKPYDYLLNAGIGTADAKGATPDWTWDCQDGPNNTRDPGGVYTLVMVDVQTGRWVATRFRVQY